MKYKFIQYINRIFKDQVIAALCEDIDINCRRNMKLTEGIIQALYMIPNTASVKVMGINMGLESDPTIKEVLEKALYRNE